MIHPDTYIKTTHKGLGVFAKRKFLRGEILWIADDFDIRISLEQYHELDPVLKTKFNIYSYLDYNNKVVVAWDEGKYVNHSCDPNSTGVLQFDNISIALRDIEADEEIVEDYYSYYGHFESFPCSCGAANCRKKVLQNDTYDAGLRMDLKDVASTILSMPQYLLNVKSGENTSIRQFLQEYAEE
jgi:hypothetical protein